MEVKDEVINVAAYAAQGVAIPADKKYLITINGDPYIFDKIHIQGRDVLAKLGKSTSVGCVIYQIIDDADVEVIDFNETIDLSIPGFEQFIVKESNIFDYFVDNDPETSDKKQLTANEILSRASYKPTDYYLVELTENGQQVSYQDRPNDLITLTHTPKKKFISIYRGNMPVS